MKQHNGEIIAGLVAALSVFVSLWFITSPVSADHMKDYVEVAVERRLGNIEEAMRGVQESLMKVREDLAGVRAVLDVGE